jgi:AGZA family xanthine/uracil permease-like MFS transporter
MKGHTSITADQIKGQLDRYFRISERGSSISTEILAGITIYISLSYIFVVNPAILAAAGPDKHNVWMSPGAILNATVITSFLGTAAMGLWARLPLAVAPGLEVSTFFTYVLVRHMHLSWEQAFGAVILSGILNVALTAAKVRELIVRSIPTGLKAALLASVGAFVFLVGLKIAGIVDVRDFTVVKPFYEKISGQLSAILFAAGFLISALLNLKMMSGLLSLRSIRLPWGMLVAVMVCAMASFALGIHPDQAIARGTQTADTRWAWSFHTDGRKELFQFFTGTIILFLVDFVGGISKIYALIKSDHSIEGNSSEVPGLKEALFVDGGATVLGGLLGTSSLIAFVESRIGIAMGGKTGLAAVVCSLFILLGLLFKDALYWVPAVATSGVLGYVGFLLGRTLWDYARRGEIGAEDIVITCCMIVAVFVTFHMDIALAIGFGLYFALGLYQGKPFSENKWVGIVAGLLLLTLLPRFMY